MPTSQKEYLQSPKPSVRLACGNCGSQKLFIREDIKLELQIAECEQCTKLFAVCPICGLPSGLEDKELGEGERFWKCPNCEVNFALQGSANTYMTSFEVLPETNNYPAGNPEVTYDTKGGVSMEDLTETLDMAPVGQITLGNEPNVKPKETAKKRGRAAKKPVEENLGEE